MTRKPDSSKRSIGQSLRVMILMIPGAALLAGCWAEAGSRYRVMQDGSSKHIFDAKDQQWVGLECELRCRLAHWRHPIQP